MLQKFRVFVFSALLGLSMLSVSGCATLQNLIGGASKPTAAVTGVHFTNLSLKDVTLVFDVTVTNPYTVPLPLVNLDYALSSQAITILEGQAPIQGSVPALGTKTIAFPTTISFAGVLAVLSNIAPGGVVPYQGVLGLSVNVPAFGPVRIPLEKQGEFPIPAIPQVSLASVTWQNISLTGANALVKIKLGNTNQFPVDLTNFSYSLNLADRDLAKGTLANSTHFSPKETQELGISLEVSTTQLGMTLTRLFQGNASHYRLNGALALGTPFGPLQIPFDVRGQVPFLR
jgi:LEA14-like dessication related protein